jgi:hypothetical protein
VVRYLYGEASLKLSNNDPIKKSPEELRKEQYEWEDIDMSFEEWCGVNWYFCERCQTWLDHQCICYTR